MGQKLRKALWGQPSSTVSALQSAGVTPVAEVTGMPGG